MKKYMIEKEAAHFVGIAPKTLRNLRNSGGGPLFINAGRRILYEVADLEAWLGQRKFSSTAARDAARHAVAG